MGRAGSGTWAYAYGGAVRKYRDRAASVQNCSPHWSL